MTEIIEQAVRDILTACTPRKVILYAEKRTMATDKLKAFSLCVILSDDADARAVRTHLHFGQDLVCRMDRPERQGNL